jgi:hypothetical protein
MSLSIKKFFVLLIIAPAAILMTTCSQQAFGTVGISMNNGDRSWSDGSYACSCSAYRNPSDTNGYHYVYDGSTGSGTYKIMPKGAIKPFEVYCDMDTDGGGWTLVLLHSQYQTDPTPTWNEAINNNNVEGDFANGLDTGVNLLFGLKYWNKLGKTLRVEVGDSSTSITHRADFTFNLSDSGSDPLYNINLSNENIVSADKTEPGLFTYHNKRPFSTKDLNPPNCSTIYGNTAWWYGSCWSGSFWGGGTYQNKPYWSPTNTDYYNWGAFWIR